MDTYRTDLRVIAGSVAVGATATVLASVWNPLNLAVGSPLELAVDSPLDLDVGSSLHLWAVAVIAVIAFVGVLRWSCRRRLLQELVTVAGVIVTVVLAWYGYVVVLLSSDLSEDVAVLASRERSELVLVEGWNIIDPMYRVELRREVGPVRQAVVVWQGRPEGARASAARFTGPDEVAVTVPRWGGRICEYRTGYDAVTLEPKRVHDDRGRTGVC